MTRVLLGVIALMSCHHAVRGFSPSKVWGARQVQNQDRVIPSGGNSVASRYSPAKISGSRSLVIMPASTPMVPYQPPGQEYAQFISIDSRLMRERIMILGNFIDEEQANSIISTLLYLKKEGPKEKISLYVNCPGALLRPALAVYDTILQCKAECEISTLNLGMATGMGALICGAGTKGKRSCMPNARFLLQRIGLEKPVQGQASDIALEVKNVKDSNERLEYELAKMTGHPMQKIRQDMKRDFYLSSEEAVRYGLIDNVLLPREKGIASVSFSRDAWTGAKVYDKEETVDLGKFTSTQRFDSSGSGGGWGSGWKVGENDGGGDDDNYDGPPTQK